MGNEITILCPFPSFPPGTFKREWKIHETKQVNDLNVIHLWTWQPDNMNPDFVERILYYCFFPVNALFIVFILAGKFDIIITSSPPLFTHIPGFFSKKILKKLWVMDIRDLWIDASISLGFLKGNSVLEKISRKFERSNLQCADMISVTTTELGRRLTSDTTITQKIVHVPNGVDIRQFFPNPRINKKNQFVYSGNIGYAQDLKLVISAIKTIKAQYSIKFLLIGGGDIVMELVDFVKENKLENNVIFMGPLPREKIPEILNESMFGIAPLKNLQSLEYAAPTKVYEYMACGLPFLGTGKGEIAIIARESGAGVMAENSVSDISKKIQYFIENPLKVTQMGMRGREYVEQRFDRKKIAEKLNEQLEMIYAK